MKKKPPRTTRWVKNDTIGELSPEECRDELWRTVRVEATLWFVWCADEADEKFRLIRQLPAFKSVTAKRLKVEAEELAREARKFAGRACKVCEHTRVCPRTGKLYEWLCSPGSDAVKRRGGLRRYMWGIVGKILGVVKSCPEVAIIRFHPRKSRAG